MCETRQKTMAEIVEGQSAVNGIPYPQRVNDLVTAGNRVVHWRSGRRDLRELEKAIDDLADALELLKPAEKHD